HAWLTKLAERRRAWLLLTLAWAVPFVTSIVMGTLALTQLDAFCKLCVLVYGASTLGFVTSLVVFLRLREPDAVLMPTRPIAIAVAAGFAFVLVPTAAYALAAPSFERYVGACRELADAS